MDKVTCVRCGAESVPEPIPGGDWCLRCGASLERFDAEPPCDLEPVVVGAESSTD